MNFSHLEYAMTVAECRSINKAAQRLLVSQPYLSGVLKNLEEDRLWLTLPGLMISTAAS